MKHLPARLAGTVGPREECVRCSLNGNAALGAICDSSVRSPASLSASSSSVFSMDRSPAYAPGDKVLHPQAPLFPEATTPEPPQSHQPQRRHLMKQLCCVPGAVLGPVHASPAQLPQRGDVTIPVVQTGEVGTERRRDSLPLSPLWSWSGYGRCHYR